PATTALGLMRCDAIAASIPLTSSRAYAELRYTSARRVMGGRPAREGLSHCKFVFAMGPSCHPVLDEGKDDVEGDAEHREDQKASEYQRHVEVRARDHHQVADAAIGRDRLGDDRADEGLRYCDLQRGEEVRHRARQSDVRQNIELARLQGAHDVLEL